MSQERFNNLIVLITYKEWLNEVNLITIANEFSDNNNERKSVFGTFKIQDKCSGITGLKLGQVRFEDFWAYALPWTEKKSVWLLYYIS